MGLWIGAVLALAISIAWALGLSVAVSRGEQFVFSPTVGPWYLFHMGTGALGLWLILQVAV